MRDWSFDLFERTTALSNGCLLLLLYEMLGEFKKHWPWANHDAHAHSWALMSPVTPSIVKSILCRGKFSVGGRIVLLEWCFDEILKALFASKMLRHSPPLPGLPDYTLMSWTKIGLIATQKPVGHWCVTTVSDAAALHNRFAEEFNIENMFFSNRGFRTLHDSVVEFPFSKMIVIILSLSCSY